MLLFVTNCKELCHNIKLHKRLRHEQANFVVYWLHSRQPTNKTCFMRIQEYFNFMWAIVTYTDTRPYLP